MNYELFEEESIDESHEVLELTLEDLSYVGGGHFIKYQFAD